MTNAGYAMEESHPTVRLVAAHLGPILGPLIAFFWKSLLGLAVIIYLRRFALYIFTPAIILSFWAAWYNVWGVNLYYPRLLKWGTHLEAFLTNLL